MDEATLLRRIIAGESSLFRILVDRYKDISLTIAYSIVKNKEDAEDVIQDSFIKAFRSLSNFKFQSSYKTWFYRIVVNTSYHSLEKSRIRKTLPIEDHMMKAGTTNLMGYKEILVNERKQAIHSTLSKLKTHDALLLKLYYLGEQSHNEIAEITGMSLSNVKVSMFRARKCFYEQLKQIIGEEIEELL